MYKTLYVRYILTLCCLISCGLYSLAHGTKQLPYAYAAVIKKGNSQETCKDRVLALPSLETHKAFFGVLNGLGGHLCSEICARTLESRLTHARSSKIVKPALLEAERAFASYINQHTQAQHSQSMFAGVWLSRTKIYLYTIGNTNACLISKRGALASSDSTASLAKKEPSLSTDNPLGVITASESLHMLGYTASQARCAKKITSKPQIQSFARLAPTDGCIIALFSDNITDTSKIHDFAVRMQKAIHWGQLDTSSHESLKEPYQHKTQSWHTESNCSELYRVAHSIVQSTQEQEDASIILIHVPGHPEQP